MVVLFIFMYVPHAYSLNKPLTVLLLLSISLIFGLISANAISEKFISARGVKVTQSENKIGYYLILSTYIITSLLCFVGSIVSLTK